MNCDSEKAKNLQKLKHFSLHKVNTILETKCFLTYSWKFLTSNKSEQLEFELERNIWDLET